MKNLLIIAYSFPPVDNVGGLRVSKIAKYLPEFGWQPTILTATPSSGTPERTPVEVPKTQILRTGLDPISLLRRRLGLLVPEPPSVSVQKDQTKLPRADNASRSFRSVLSLLLYNRLVNLIAEHKLRWYPQALVQGINLIRSCQFDAILSSSNPAVVNYLASYLQKSSGTPWVAEFRDLWSHSHIFRRFAFEEGLEKRVLRNATHLVTVSSPLATTLSELHHKPVTVIPNGFDETDYPRETRPRQDKLTMVYTGITYYQQDPTPLLRALQQLKLEGLISSANFELSFYGANLKSVQGLPEQYGIEDLVRWRGWVSLLESQKAQLDASILLHLNWMDPRSLGVYTTKIFEYLGARRPILSVGPKHGVSVTLLKETQSGFASESVEEIVGLLKKWLEEWKLHGEIAFKPNDAMRKCYSRREQARKMAEILDEVSKQTRRNPPIGPGV